MDEGKTLIHVTHETVGKVGGIGAVLAGFFTSQKYLDNVSRSIVLGPLFHYEGPLQQRLGEDVEILYSSVDGFNNTKYAQAFGKIEQIYNTPIIYGRRTFTDPKTGITSRPELLLIDVRIINKEPVNELKRKMYEHFQVKSNLYEHIWEYDQYVRLAPAGIAALKAIGAGGPGCSVIAHEFMGMPTALASILDTEFRAGTIFYAHEVATVRHIVENHPGHDTMFYNVMKYCLENRFYIKDVFGSQEHYFKHPLVEAAKYLDCIFAVGDYVAEEMRFLAPEFENADINITYNGIPAYHIELEEKLKSKQKLQQYCENLLGLKPDFIFTHVTRLVRSKGLWRDLLTLEHIEKKFRQNNKTGVMFLLSTEVCQKRPLDIFEMESRYNWPVAHREGWPDLSGGEADLYAAIQRFNARSRKIKIVFLNQFGFTHNLCGRKMPEDMEFLDIRKGTDVEFGMSVYEPFGISQLEPLTFGGLCVFTNVCGCAGFIRDVTDANPTGSVIIADFTNLHEYGFDTIENLVDIDQNVRSNMESRVTENIAARITAKISQESAILEDDIITGYSLAKNMSWDMIVEHYLLPGLNKIEQHPRRYSLNTI